MSDITSIKFRMYNTGSVGDCLLLLFMKGEKISFKMLIDCGGWNTNSQLVTPCVEDIKKTCESELDLLVVTHQHEDHVSGFNQAREVFNQIKVKKVWMSWMENPKDSIGKIVKEKYGKKIKAAIKQAEELKEKLQHISRQKYEVTSMKRRFGVKTIRANLALGLLRFEEGSSYGKRLKKGAQTNQNAIDYVRKKGKSIRYWKPGEVEQNVPGAEGIKFFMLGPPRDADMKLFFTKVAVEKEIYELALKATSTEEEDLPAHAIFASSGTLLTKGQSPFASKYNIRGAALTEWNKKYNHYEMAWRQIETDSEESAFGIALGANRYTNNTSFAMAIEFNGSGRVILLPGDAQSGNWMGWHKPDVKKSLKEKGGKDTVELLRDTVFYKIGHHCSENGTASISGLDMMKAADLVGFIPLIKNKIPDVWHPEGFPAKPLYRELIKKTNGRLVRLDEGIIKDIGAQKLRDELPKKEKDSFEKAYTKGPCYHEFVISGK